MDSRICQIIFANLINELMIHKPDLIHSASLSAVSPRKIWLAYENDIVITILELPEEDKKTFHAEFLTAESGGRENSPPPEK